MRARERPAVSLPCQPADVFRAPAGEVPVVHIDLAVIPWRHDLALPGAAHQVDEADVGNVAKRGVSPHRLIEITDLIERHRVVAGEHGLCSVQ